MAKSNMTKSHSGEPTRRDFLLLTAGAMGTVGAGASLLPLIKSMNPAADVLALSSVDIDLTTIPKGQTAVVMWRGKPVFVRHRTEEEIKIAHEANLKSLKDPQTDEQRVQNPEWLVVIGVCTHLGCIPTERKSMTPADAGGGWLCSCHGSRYDGSGRIVEGPAPKNLEVPEYHFVNNNTVLRIG